MIRCLALAAVLAAGLAAPALAQQQFGGVSLYDYKGQPLGTSANPVAVTGSGSSAGSVTAAGTNGTVAQSVQGITGGVPLNGFTGQYNSTLPTLASGATGYLAVDTNGRLILSPGGSISVSNFPSSQAVTNAGTFAVQNTAAVIGGNTTAVKTDGSAVTQPVSAASLPLPTGAATSANQSSEISALGTTTDTAFAGTGAASIISALKGVYSATSAPALPSGAATSANQSSEIAALTAIQQRAAIYVEQATNTATTASQVINGSSRDVGTTPVYTKYNIAVSSSQSASINLQGSNDNFATAVNLASQSLTANTPAIVTIPVAFRYHRYVFTNGSTAGTVSINSSYTAN